MVGSLHREMRRMQAVPIRPIEHARWPVPGLVLWGLGLFAAGGAVRLGWECAGFLLAWVVR